MFQLLAVFGLLTGCPDAPATVPVADTIAPVHTVHLLPTLSLATIEGNPCPNTFLLSALRKRSTESAFRIGDSAVRFPQRLARPVMDVQHDAYPIRLEGHEAVWENDKETHEQRSTR